MRWPAGSGQNRPFLSRSGRKRALRRTQTPLTAYKERCDRVIYLTCLWKGFRGLSSMILAVLSSQRHPVRGAAAAKKAPTPQHNAASSPLPCSNHMHIYLACRSCAAAITGLTLAACGGDHSAAALPPIHPHSHTPRRRSQQVQRIARASNLCPAVFAHSPAPSPAGPLVALCVCGV